MASSSIIHELDPKMRERIERTIGAEPDVLGITEIEEGGHTVTTVLYRTATELNHPSTPDDTKQVTLRSEIFVDGEGQTGLLVATTFEEPPASSIYSQLVEYVEANSGAGARIRVGERLHTGYLTLEHGSDSRPARIRLRDPRRGGGSQYQSVFERNLDPDAEGGLLEMRCANGRYAPVTAFFAGGAAERAAKACKSCGSLDVDEAGRCDACGAVQ